MLADTKLPINLTSDWYEGEETKDKPFPSYASVFNKCGKPAGETRYSWTVDFATRRAKAREEMQPLLNEANDIKATVVNLKEQLKGLKKEKAGKEAIDSKNEEITKKTKAARELEAKAADIDAAVYDLKAVNPNTIEKVDTRTPLEIIVNIEEQGRIVSKALSKLSGLLGQ